MRPLPSSATAQSARQFGVISRRQLLRHLPERQVDLAVENGHLEIVHWGVYRIPGSPRTPEQSAMAAVLRTRSGRVGGPFVLGLYGADGFAPTTEPFAVLVRPGRVVTNVDFSVFRDHALGRFDASWNGLPALAPAFACVEAAHPRYGLTRKRLRVAVDSLRWSGLVSSARLDHTIRELPRHPGARILAKMFTTGELVNESEPERDVDRIVMTISPAPERQVVVVPGRRCDFVWRVLRFILEYDGEVHHFAQHQLDDADRDLDLEAAGYEVEHVTKRDLANPDQFRSWLVATLQRRARELGLDLVVRYRP
jgi:hypothetical protein